MRAVLRVVYTRFSLVLLMLFGSINSFAQTPLDPCSVKFGKPINLYEGRSMQGIELSPDGRLAAWIGEDSSKLYLFDLENSEQQWVRLTFSISSLIFLPGTDKTAVLIVAGIHSELTNVSSTIIKLEISFDEGKVSKTETTQKIAIVSEFAGAKVSTMLFNPVFNYFVTDHEEGSIRVFSGMDLKAGPIFWYRTSLMNRLDGTYNRRKLKFSPDGRSLFRGWRDGVEVYEMKIVEPTSYTQDIMIMNDEMVGLQEHQVFNKPTMPGAGFVSLVLEALKAKEAGPIALKVVKILEPLPLNGLLAELVFTDDGKKIGLIEKGGRKNNITAKRMSSGTQPPESLLASVDLSGTKPITESDDNNLSSEAIYRLFLEELSLGYGPNFQKMSAVQIYPEQYLARASVVFNKIDWPNFALDPGALDSAFQLLAPLMHYIEEVDSPKNMPAVPAKMGRVWFDPTLEVEDGSKLDVVIRLDPSISSKENGYRYDLQILKDGQILFAIQDGVMMPVSLEDLFRENQ